MASYRKDKVTSICQIIGVVSLQAYYFEPLREVVSWVDEFESFFNERLDALADPFAGSMRNQLFHANLFPDKPYRCQL